MTKWVRVRLWGALVSALPFAGVTPACGGQVSTGVGGESHFLCGGDGDCAVHGDGLTCSEDHVCISAETGELISAPYWRTCATASQAPAQTGDVCDYGCKPSDFCSCGAGHICSMRSFLCDGSGTMRVSSSTLLGCESGVQPDDGPTEWSDCAQALAGGRSGDSCTDGWVCATASDDPCCIEIAECTSALYVPPGSNMGLSRFHVCSESCTTLSPNPELPIATDCQSAYEGALRAGQPCAGSFICVQEGDGVRATPLDTTAGEKIDIAFWCAAGVVQVATDITSAGL